MKRIQAGLIFILLFFNLFFTYGQIEITLRKSFADSLKNKVSFSAEYLVKFSHARPNPPGKDGDLHIAGWASGIGLPVVAEIMNAKFQPGAVDLIHHCQDSGIPLKIEGAWRFWCEHAASSEIQEQGGDHPDITNSNPPHVFEFHPVLRVDDIDLTASLVPITGYKYKDADDAFNRYSNAKCRIEDLGSRIRITTNGVGYNYAEFWIELLDVPEKVDDGSFVPCMVMNRGKGMIYSRMRMVFPLGSEAERKLASMKKGAQMHVLGIPRISLVDVMDRVAQSRTEPSVLTWNLPVEMIIVADLSGK